MHPYDFLPRRDQWPDILGGLAIIAYLIGFVLTFGSLSGSYVRGHNDCLKNTEGNNKVFLCRYDIDAFIGPPLGAIIWPIYWTLHLTTEAFS